MNTHTIPLTRTHGPGAAPPIYIDTYKWGTHDYRPKVEVFLSHNNTRLFVTFVAHELEGDLRTLVNTDGAHVCDDSCVEFFFQPYPADPRYINIEINPLGTATMSLRTGRADKTLIIHEYKHLLHIIAHITPTHWTVSLELPFDMLAQIFDAPRLLQSGDVCRGNFYKCGDATERPHFGMWNEVQSKTPNFHEVRGFGELTLS